MSNPNDEAIQKLITEFNALHSEYQTKFTLYNQLKDTYTAELQKVNGGNPCGSYSLLGNSTNISQACFSQIWSDQKCTTTAPRVDSSKTFMQLLTDVFTKSKSSSDADKTSCYGPAPATGTDTRIFNTADVAVANGRDTNFSKASSSTQNYTWKNTPGGIVLPQVTQSSEDDCLQLCSKTNGCTGATYDITNANAKSCTLVTGPGKLMSTSSSSPKKTAIFLKLTNYSNELNNLYQELGVIMNNLEAKSIAIQDQLDDVNINLNTLSNQSLREEYEILFAEKSALRDLLNQRTMIQASYKEENNMATNEKTRLRFWTIIAIIMILFIIKYFLGIDSPSINIIFLITVFIVLSFSLSSPSGFAAMGILFLVFLMLIMNNFI
jgi:hypothetical protein